MATSEGKTNRRLAAILAADVVGYSRMMAADEVGTLAALKSRRRAVLDPLVAKHGGRLFKLVGDGALVEFASAVNAVQCAVELQEAFAAANVDVEDNRRIVLRIGVHLGDVMVEGSDLYGDGVNIAARLEGLAEPGGVLVSDDVQRQVGNKLSVAFEDIGPQNLKNIPQPVRAFRTRSGSATPTLGEPAPKTAGLAGAGVAAEAKLSIAILPFSNMSGDKEQDYFSDGITEDIITELSRFRELPVIARNSSFAFRGQNVNVQEVGRKLGAAFVVEGSVRRSGNRVRITVQLIETETNRHVWAERYDRDLNDIFAVQDEIARTVAGLSAGHAKLAAIARIKSRPTDNLSAYDLVLQSRATLRHYGNHYENAALLEKVIALDPNYALAHALMANSLQQQSLYERDPKKRERAAEFARRAIQLDPAEPWGHIMLGYCLTFSRRWSEAEVHYERALDLNPNDTYLVMLHALSLVYVGKADDAIARMQFALARDPFAHDWFWDDYMGALTVAGRYKDALMAFEKIAGAPPAWSYYYAAIAHLKLGDIENAKRLLARFKEASPDASAQDFIRDEPFADPAVPERLVSAIMQIETALQAEGAG